MLFFFGVPQLQGVLTWRRNPAREKRDRIFSNLGFVLLILGFALQIISNHVGSINTLLRCLGPWANVAACVSLLLAFLLFWAAVRWRGGSGATAIPESPATKPPA